MTKCSAGYSRNSSGYSLMQWGTYIRGPGHTSGSYQGAHGYHLFNPNIPAGKWIKWVVTNKPNHVVGEDPGNNWEPDSIVPYAGRNVQTGSSSQSSWIRIIQDDGITPITSYAALSGIDLVYQRDQDTPVTITKSSLASAGAAFAAGGMYHVGSGWWRIDIPNAAWNSGVTVVSVTGGADNTIVSKVEHLVGSGYTNTPPNQATEVGSRRKYFDLATRMYLDMIQTPDFPGTWDCGDFRFYEEPNTTPEHEISNYCIYYTGTRYEFEFQALKNIARTFEVRYRLDGLSMRANGFTSGTSGGTVDGNANDYTGVLWASANMAESTNGIYIAIRVQGETDFIEDYFPYNYGPGNDGYSTQYGGGGGGSPGDPDARMLRKVMVLR
jgi:hypothetical protein